MKNNYRMVIGFRRAVKWFSPALFYATFVLSAGCGKEPNRESTVLINSDSIRNTILKNGKIDSAEIVKLAKLYIKRAETTQSDSIAAESFYEAARLYHGPLQNHYNAIALFSKVYNDYPKSEQAPMALFFWANACHDINDTTEAIKNFALFAKTFPNHEFADDATNMIKFIRLNPIERDKFFGNASGDSMPVQ